MTLPLTLSDPAVPPVQMTVGVPLIVMEPGPLSVSTRLLIFSVLAVDALVTVIVNVVVSPV